MSFCCNVAAEQGPSVLAVLTESGLVLLNMSTSTESQEIKHSCGTIMLQYVYSDGILYNF